MESRKFNANKIVRPSISETVYHDLRQRIVSGEWTPGERIPSENEIAEAYGVSRVSVRSALQKLIALNLLENRQGDGTYVAKFRLTDFLDNISDLLAQKVTFEDVSDFRMKIEDISIRETCARSHAPEDFAKLEGYVARMEQIAPTQDLTAFINVDYRFHREICYLSGNAMWAYAYMMMFSINCNYWSQQISVDNLHSKGQAFEDYWDRAVESPRSMLEYVKKGDAESAIAVIHSCIY